MPGNLISSMFFFKQILNKKNPPASAEFVSREFWIFYSQLICLNYNNCTKCHFQRYDYSNYDMT